jgi:putative Mg2+ transporter-C (MgtC) family protein
MSDSPLYESWAQLSTILVPFVVRCGAAALCGAIIGMERELKNKPAGFRTNILICLGAAMYMSVGLLLTHEGGQAGSDPARIAAQVVTGIGFIGAGCIIQERQRIKGITTAATIWVVAAIGIIAGAGFPILAFVSALMVTTTLVALRTVEKRFLEPERDQQDESGESG